MTRPKSEDAREHVGMPSGVSLPEDGRILYYRRDRAEFGFLSHFHPSPFLLDGEAWPTVEHFYQEQKSADPEYRSAIRAAVHPGHVKRLSTAPHLPKRLSKGSWFKKTGSVPRSDWDEVKFDIMYRADQAKYLQNPDLAALLLATREAELIEDSTSDAFWGIGSDGLGLNRAGALLVQIRSHLREASLGDRAVLPC